MARASDVGARPPRPRREAANAPAADVTSSGGAQAASAARSIAGVDIPTLRRLRLRCLLGACAYLLAVTAAAAAGVRLVPAGVLAAGWAWAEALWVWWFVAAWRRLSAQPAPHRPTHKDWNPRHVFDRFIRDQAALRKYICINEMISKWFWGVPMTQLTRHNVADLLVYGFWYRTRDELAAEGLAHLPEQLVGELEAAWGVTFPDGPYTPRPMMAHLHEPVRAHYRPLAFYAGVEVLIGLKHCIMLAAGFRAHVEQGLRYYTLGLPAASRRTASAPQQQQQQQAPAPAPSSSASAPVLFMHGVGLGLLPYTNFLLQLGSLGRPVVAAEVRHLSMRACAEVPDEDEVVGCIVDALRTHGVAQVHVVAHSYGTFMASRLVQLQPRMVASLSLLDPVCFIMFSGKLIHSFVYRTPAQGASFLTWFIARDLAHGVSVSRRFYWSLLNLWPDQLPEHTLVAMGARDELVPVQEVQTMLEARPATRLLMHRRHQHADFIKDLPWQARMVQEVAELLAEAGGARVRHHARSDSASSYEVMAGLSSNGAPAGAAVGKKGQ